jgi:hypothetical protein
MSPGCSVQPPVNAAATNQTRVSIMVTLSLHDRCAATPVDLLTARKWRKTLV